MTTETLRDNLQRIVGYIETHTDGSKIGRDSSHVIKGYYDPGTNITRDATMRIVGYGDELVGLILNS